MPVGNPADRNPCPTCNGTREDPNNWTTRPGDPRKWPRKCRDCSDGYVYRCANCSGPLPCPGVPTNTHQMDGLRCLRTGPGDTRTGNEIADVPPVGWSPSPGEVQRFGYWRGRHDSDMPDPREFVDESWDPAVRKAVVERLKLGAAYAMWMGYSGCRICGCNNGTMCFTLDGSWVWPEGLAHYVEAHGVRPPPAMVEHLLTISPEILSEMARHRTTTAMHVKHYQSVRLERCGGPCKITKEGPGDEFRCRVEGRNGGSIEGSGCYSRSKDLQDLLKVERARHREVLLGLVKVPWDSGSLSDLFALPEGFVPPSSDRKDGEPSKESL